MSDRANDLHDPSNESPRSGSGSGSSSSLLGQEDIHAFQPIDTPDPALLRPEEIAQLDEEWQPPRDDSAMAGVEAGFTPMDSSVDLVLPDTEKPQAAAPSAPPAVGPETSSGVLFGSGGARTGPSPPPRDVPAVTAAPPPPSPAREPAAATAAESPPAGGSGSLLVVLFFTWASIATILAGFYYYQWQYGKREPSPFENLPDDGYLAPAVKRKGIVSPLEHIPPHDLFELGKTRRVGFVAVTPLRIENRRLRLHTSDERESEHPLLVLHLRLENVSMHQSFRPADPGFFFYRVNKTIKGLEKIFPPQLGYTYTFIHPVAGNVKPLLQPFEVMYDFDHRVEGQRFDVLGPGEIQETIVVMESGLDSLEVGGDLVWRVQLRKGLTETGEGVATVIGVRFRKEDVIDKAR